MERQLRKLLLQAGKAFRDLQLESYAGHEAEAHSIDTVTRCKLSLSRYSLEFVVDFHSVGLSATFSPSST